MEKLKNDNYIKSNNIFSIEIPIDLNIAYGEYQNQSLCWTQPLNRKILYLIFIKILIYAFIVVLVNECSSIL